MLCHLFIVNLDFLKIIYHKKKKKISFLEDENAPGLPTLDDHQAPANEQNRDNHMDVDPAHIPGVDDTTLLSNVSDEFVLPPISTTGKLKKKEIHFLFYFLFFFKLKHQQLDKQLNVNEN
jgi:hypothetical protein